MVIEKTLQEHNTTADKRHQSLLHAVPSVLGAIAGATFYALGSQPETETKTVTTQLLPTTALKAGDWYTLANGDTVHYWGLNAKNQALITVWQPNGQEAYAGPVPGLNGNNPVTLQIGSHTWMAFKLINNPQNTNSPDMQAYIFSYVNYVTTVVQHDLILPIALGIVGAGVAASALLHMLRSGSRKKSSALTEKLRKPSA